MIVSLDDCAANSVHCAWRDRPPAKTHLPEHASPRRTSVHLPRHEGAVETERSRRSVRKQRRSARGRLGWSIDNPAPHAKTTLDTLDINHSLSMPHPPPPVTMSTRTSVPNTPGTAQRLPAADPKAWRSELLLLLFWEIDGGGELKQRQPLPPSLPSTAAGDEVRYFCCWPDAFFGKPTPVARPHGTASDRRSMTFSPAVTRPAASLVGPSFHIHRLAFALIESSCISYSHLRSLLLYFHLNTSI